MIEYKVCRICGRRFLWGKPIVRNVCMVCLRWSEEKKDG